MKKLFAILAVAAVAAAACSKVERIQTPDTKIGYQVANYMSDVTKAGETSFLSELSALGVAAANASFKSSAFINADDGNGGHNFSAFYASNPETISWNTSTTEWEPSRDYYWPKSPKSNIDFFSWYNFSAGDPTLTNTAGTSATLAWTNRTVAYKDDILFADVAWHQTANSENYQLDGVSEGVPTLFHHALAQVRFAAKIKENCDKKADSKNNGYYTFWEVTLDDVALAANKVHKNGTLSLTITDPVANDASTPSTGAWTKPANDIWADAASPAYVGATEWFTTDYATGVEPLTLSYNYLNDDSYMADNYIAVRPQAIGNDITISFTMTINTYYGTDLASAKSAGATNTEVIDIVDYAGTAPFTATGIQLNAMTDAPAYWAMNKKITYNFIIDPSTSTILYDPAVEAWGTAESGTANIE